MMRNKSVSFISVQWERPMLELMWNLPSLNVWHVPELEILILYGLNISITSIGCPIWRYGCTVTWLSGIKQQLAGWFHIYSSSALYCLRINHHDADNFYCLSVSIIGCPTWRYSCPVTWLSGIKQQLAGWFHIYSSSALYCLKINHDADNF